MRAIIHGVFGTLLSICVGAEMTGEAPYFPPYSWVDMSVAIGAIWILVSIVLHYGSVRSVLRSRLAIFLAVLSVGGIGWAAVRAMTAPTVETSSPPLTAEEQFVSGVMGRPLMAIERETRRIKPTTKEISARYAARTLLSLLENPGGKQWAGLVVAQALLLNSRGLSPLKGYERLPIVDRHIHADPSRPGSIYLVSDGFYEVVDGPGWHGYLSLLLPLLEKFGMERALHETRRYNNNEGGE